MAELIKSGVINTVVVYLTSGDTVEVKNNMVDVLRWEKKNGKGYAGQDNTAILEVAYYAAKRQRLVDVPQFDVWSGQVEDYAIRPPEEPEMDPTQTADTDD